MTSLTIPGPYHRHVDYETGQIFHVDPITGAITARNDIVLPKSRNAEFQAWAAQRRADANLTTDHTTAQASLIPENGINATEVVAAEPIKQGRGVQRQSSTTQRLPSCLSLRSPIRCLG